MRLLHCCYLFCACVSRAFLLAALFYLVFYVFAHFGLWSVNVMAKFAVDLDREEHIALVAALGLAVASSRRLSNRVGVTPAVKQAYEREVQTGLALQAKVSAWKVS